MDIQGSDYEKLGKFYLGRGWDTEAGELDDDLVLYDSKDLVTHGVVLGMTGSGKTGLCMALLEEAAMDSIPAIVIDPKGDIPNLMLQFPNFQPQEFRPWINEDDARKKGVTPDEWAQKQADLWKNGLNDWGQSGERIRSMQSKVDLNVFTPGSNAGIPVSILSSLSVPEFEIMDDSELLGERIESTVTSLLSLLGIDADPIQSPEHILLSNIFSTCWARDESLSLQAIIQYIQTPPFDKIGVLSLDDFYDEKDRFELSMKMNSLLASPGFATWLRGVPLDINKMMTAPDGRARVSIFSIAHLSDTERMFFVSLLLNQVLGWMRTQSGTSSLRALLYMDEIFGYLPPTANPPSKKPLMTMLKQARAFGLGVLLATQNPVDLDYKALSNIGTWFLGRLQTERDKMRVLDGLEGAASSQNASFNKKQLEMILSGLGSRVFMLNNVHDDGPDTFHVRWVMSYLRGPLARRQIKELMDPKRDQFPILELTDAESEKGESGKTSNSQKPVVSGRIDEFFLPVAADRLHFEEVIYMPAVIRSAQVRFSEARYDLNRDDEVTLLNRIYTTSGFDWKESLQLPTEMSIRHLQGVKPHNPKEYGDLPGEALDSKRYTELKDEFEDHLYHNHAVTLLQAESFEMYSAPGESEAEFRARLSHRAREVRDEAIEELREKYEKKLNAAEDRIERAIDDLEDQEAQSSSARMSAVMSIGGTLLKAVLGRGRSGISATAARSASSGASRAWKEGRDVVRAKEEVEELEDEFKELEKELEKLIEELEAQLDPKTVELTPVEITPYKKNIRVTACGIAWLPFVRRSEYELEKAWL